jgi:hypothetical protein
LSQGFGEIVHQQPEGGGLVIGWRWCRLDRRRAGLEGLRRREGGAREVTTGETEKRRSRSNDRWLKKLDWSHVLFNMRWVVA